MTQIAYFDFAKHSILTPVGIVTNRTLPWVYPRGMSGKPRDPRSSPRSTPGSTASEITSGRAGQRTGALAVSRHVKDDGRALILYSHADHDLGGADSSAVEREQA